MRLFKKRVRKYFFQILIVVFILSLLFINRSNFLQNTSMTQAVPTSENILKFEPSSSPSIVPTNKPLKVLTPPSPTPSIKVTPISHLDSVTPNSGISRAGMMMTLKGSGFGAVNLIKGEGTVYFYDSAGVRQGGMSAQSWSDTEVLAAVPDLKGGTQYFVEVANSATGSRSNRLPFTITNGTPTIISFPSHVASAGQVTLGGVEFGASAGKVNIYTIDSGHTNLVGSCQISSWIDTSVVCTLPSLSPNSQGYIFDLSTADHRSAQWKTFYIK